MSEHLHTLAGGSSSTPQQYKCCWGAGQAVLLLLLALKYGAKIYFMFINAAVCRLPAEHSLQALFEHSHPGQSAAVQKTAQVPHDSW